MTLYPVVSDTVSDLPPHLKVVNNNKTTYFAQREAPKTMPAFEGHAVAGSLAKVSSSPLDLDGAIFAVDDTIKVILEVQVIGVSFPVDQKTGEMRRLHHLKGFDGVVVDWDLDLEDVRGEKRNHE